jgi:hypothetical protein
MSDIETMQRLLDVVITRIEEFEEKIVDVKKKDQKDLKVMAELRGLKKALSLQQRAKITLIQSIQELTPSTNVMTIFTPLKRSSFLSKIRNFLRV